jgi:histidinol phosphatase-like PHP family hydrolase
MEFLADLHVHSNFSDGKLSIPQLIDFYGQRGFGCIAVTDHICEDRTFLGVAASYLNLSLTPDTFDAYMALLQEEAERAWRLYRMVVIPGFELSKNSWFNHRSAHVLGLGVHEFVSADGDILSLLRAIRSQGALSIAAHPVSTGKFEPQTFHLWSRRDELALEFDAWEVASGPRLFEAVLESGLPLVASSDFHHPGHINAWKTVFDCERHPQAILDAIREQRLTFRFYNDVTQEAFAPLQPVVLT